MNKPKKKTKKKIRVCLDDGREFEIDAHKVAHNRAEYYAKKDPDTTYQEEYDFTAGDDYELTYWLQNNMDWYELNPVEVSKGEMPLLSECDVEDVYVEDDEE